MDENCNQKSLFACLEARGILSSTNVRMLTIFVDQWRVSPLQAIIDTHLLTEPEIANALAKNFQMDRLYGLKNHRVDQHSLQLLSFKEAKENVAVLLCDDTGRYDLVVADPSDGAFLEALKAKSPVSFTLAVGERREIVRAIDEKYPLDAQLPSLFGG